MIRIKNIMILIWLVSTFLKIANDIPGTFEFGLTHQDHLDAAWAAIGTWLQTHHSPFHPSPAALLKLVLLIHTLTNIKYN